MRFYAVECKGCDVPLILGRCDRDSTNADSYAAPVKPVPCPGCGGRHIYVSQDIFEFETDDAA
jgi:hypothetical protein